jgi:DNA-binding transcriptional LysR family regulator
MKLRQLEIFRAVYLAGSVAGAALALKISAPAVSRMLGFIESKLQYSLFTRTHSGLLPTFEAQQLFRSSNLLFEKLTEFGALATTLQLGVGRQLRIGCSSTANLRLVPLAVKRFTERYKTTSVSFNLVQADTMLGQILSSEIDVGVSGIHVEHPEVLVQPLRVMRLVLAFRRGHPISFHELARNKSLAIDVVSPLRRVRFSSPSTQIRDVEARLQQIDDQTVSVRLSISALAFVRVTDFVCIIDELAVKDCGFTDIDFLPLEELPTFSLSLVSLQQSPTANLVAQFRECLTEVITRSEENELLR